MKVNTMRALDENIIEDIEELKLERDRALTQYVNACSKLAQAHAVKQLRQAMGARIAGTDSDDSSTDVVSLRSA